MARRQQRRDDPKGGGAGLEAALKLFLQDELTAQATLLAQREAEIVRLSWLVDSAEARIAQEVALQRALQEAPRRASGRLAALVGIGPGRRARAALRRSPLFDAGWYRATYPGVRGSALAHYLRIGAFLGHDPGPEFDSMAYYRANPDVAETGWAALAHYELFGRAEGRALSLPLP